MTDEKKKAKILLAAGDIGSIAVNQGPWLAVVSSDDSLLSHGGGVSEALWSAAGIESDESALPLPLGTIHRTNAGKIDAIHLLHAVTIDADRWIGLDAVELASLIDHLAEFLESAIEDQGSESSVRRRVLLPLLGTGVAGVPVHLVLREIGRLVTRFSSACDFVLATDVQFETVKKGLGIEHGVGRLTQNPGKGRSPRRQGGDGRSGSVGGMGDNNFKPWRAQDLAERDQALKHSQGFFRQQRQDRSRSRGGGQRGPAASVRLTGPVKISEPITIKDLSAATGVKGAEIVKKLFLEGISATINSAIETELAIEIMMEYEIVLQVEEAKSAAEQVFEEQVEMPGSAESEPTDAPDPPAVGGQSKFVTNVSGRSDSVKPAVRRRESRWENQGGQAGRRKSGRADENITIPPAIGHKVPHVDRLVDILVGLNGQEASEVESMLDALGYQGARRLRIKEYCIREDPRDIAKRLGAFRLKQVLETEFLVSDVDPKESLEDISRRLLLACGFQEIPVPHGLDSACERLAVLRSKIVNCDPSERVGLVLQAAGRVERVAADFLRFICLYLFDAGPERHLDGVANYDGRPLAKTTLGMILQLLDHLAKDLDSRSQTDLKALAPILRERRLVPKVVPQNESGETLARMRNTFAHLTGEGSDVPSLDSARSFFRLAEELLEYWREPGPRAYPKVIRIESVSIDVWNRRVIDAKSDAGTSEVIVCDHEVRPGGLYFMLPRSNPFRVDPVLVAFGRADQGLSPTLAVQE